MIEHMADYKIQLVRLSKEHIIAFKEEMQEAFEHGFKSHCHENEDANDDSNQWQVLPDKDFYPQAWPSTVPEHSPPVFLFRIGALCVCYECLYTALNEEGNVLSSSWKPRQ